MSYPENIRKEVAAIQAEGEKHQKDSYEAFMRRPEVKALLSLVGASEALPEATQTLLQAAFDHGYGSGTGFVLFKLVQRINTRHDPD